MLRNIQSQRRGSVTIIFLLLLTAVIAVGAMAVDFALVESARTDLRVSCDLASRAAMVDYISSESVESARQIAKSVARKNGVILSEFKLRNSDIIPGNSAPDLNNKYVFTANQLPYNSFKVNGALTPTSRAGSLPLMFSGVHSRVSVDLEETATATETHLDIVLVLDRSGSMAFDLTGTEWQYPDGESWTINYYTPPMEGSRWESLEGAIDVFLNEMDKKTKKEHVALVTYSSTVTYYSSYYNDYFSSVEVSTDETFTTDYTEIMDAVTDIGSEAVIGGTAISSGIDEAITLLGASPRTGYSEKIIVLFTDGVWNHGYDPVVAAQTAQENGIKIHTVSFGSNAGSSVMSQVASTTGGIHFDAPGSEELSQSFREIARSIGLTYTE
ncbi:MAG: VWA domain-containing protein [Aureliella sp.]